jgi:hypothetical protein
MANWHRSDRSLLRAHVCLHHSVSRLQELKAGFAEPRRALPTKLGWTPRRQAPGGKTVFTVLGAIGELEPSLILERVKAGRIATLRSRWASSATICGETGADQHNVVFGESAEAQ